MSGKNRSNAVSRSDRALDAKEIRATCDELAADYQVPPDVLAPIYAYADTLDTERTEYGARKVCDCGVHPEPHVHAVYAEDALAGDGE